MLVAWLVFCFNIYFSELALNWYCKWNRNSIVPFAIFYGFLVRSSFKSFTAARLHIFSEYPSSCNRICTIICCIPNLIDQWVWYRFLSGVIMDMLYGATAFYSRENKFLDVWIVAVHLSQVFLCSPENWTKMMSGQTWFFSSALHSMHRADIYTIRCPLHFPVVTKFEMVVKSQLQQVIFFTSRL